MYAGPERRKYRRIEEPFILEFQGRVKGVKEDDPDGWNLVGLQDLSAGGVRFFTRRDLGVDSFLNIRLTHADFDRSLECVGKVIRVEELDYAGLFSIAVAFTEISNNDWGILVKLTKNLYP